ncbi:hypothetical protein PCANC_15249 [Puccinia coronata f. sp. avenae]|uniref:Uncharacterized protein n=1 Tax=Puccinia coronata f. sp. avenae TaxID=200324 RepID=A0A2N5VNI0_9BASI|nr:hypothetical protein PCANC_15249 [Puccinia coronata f. sp. avenae]
MQALFGTTADNYHHHQHIFCSFCGSLALATLTPPPAVAATGDLLWHQHRQLPPPPAHLLLLRTTSDNHDHHQHISCPFCGCLAPATLSPPPALALGALRQQHSLLSHTDTILSD